jgi:hypothetical protein
VVAYLYCTAFPASIPDSASPAQAITTHAVTERLIHTAALAGSRRTVVASELWEER